VSTPEQEGGRPSEEELRAYEAELARISTTDVILQVSVSLLNIGARRLAPAPPQGAAGQPPSAGERDLEQVRDAIDAARALLGILERRVPAQELAPLRDALSQLQMAYAREIALAPDAGPQETSEGSGAAGDEGGEEGGGSAGGGGEGGGGPGEGGGGAPPGEQPPSRGPGPAQSSGRLWVPGQ